MFHGLAQSEVDRQREGGDQLGQPNARIAVLPWHGQSLITDGVCSAPETSRRHPDPHDQPDRPVRARVTESTAHHRPESERRFDRVQFEAGAARQRARQHPARARPNPFRPI